MILLGRLVLTSLLTYALWVVLNTNIWVITEQYWFAFLFSSLNLGIHEAGHMLFLVPKLIIGEAKILEFVHVAGGSLTQWMVPILITFYFIRKRNFFAASIILFWVGYSFLDSVLYIGDAMSLKLPLLGNMDAGGHDWNYLLHEMGVLYRAKEISKFVESIAIIFMTARVVLSWLCIFVDVSIKWKTKIKT